jgi:antitoxin component of MazEF toxin-antitoxin module
MIKTLTKHGDSLVLVFDQPLLELMPVTADTQFEITTDGRSLILTPVREQADGKQGGKRTE